MHDTSSGDSLLPTQVMETNDPSALLAWNWKLRAAKSMEMGVKRERKQWISDQDNRVIRCECSCDQEESLMVLLGPVTAGNCLLTSSHLAPVHLLPKTATLSLLWLCFKDTRIRASLLSMPS